MQPTMNKRSTDVFQMHVCMAELKTMSPLIHHLSRSREKPPAHHGLVTAGVSAFCIYSRAQLTKVKESPMQTGSTIARVVSVTLLWFGNVCTWTVKKKLAATDRARCARLAPLLQTLGKLLRQIASSR
eukprot:653524-Amphidinium_carterae.1